MSGFKEMLLDVLRLTDEVKRMNKDIERVESIMLDVDKRVVRLETIVEIAKSQGGQPKLPKK
ncbi:MAG: hypothetical protein KUF77_09345 [Candidatus Thiodiazotropha sp. (ex Lucina aurantia)]|nr:hypothetical protein [Candidatus Thiodiazotropha endolucinida]MBT3011296.1 hypothetical protein [Candidatus Thiodiazotropha sp. (ex Lucina pensylvanica)]MBT3015607.1 hypothetical protein [Candidatus Thiodiazotropha taylori]MBT3043862.1 hypothetical protein [Candidatus Thiodiazotropha sp. (ex Codakia orbicularis)]MBV2103212.1 hypothetical protein [Candidatus Thiodiazotropha sp. (ex Lucina aurantia)]MBW9267289.1 hypothetical protein [Candidatus Thiodiazotropha sp. (ex. Lucinisca nassula)]PUB